ncbi:isopenicillin N synthase family dioxygenase [Streptomyces sp. NRRL S-646]|uniref:isopenicillin N synthase family dioxygenase n=1 Tax=Streptomyces sp. NRRL S-646 TaxID=1463917 RepID=UPI00068D2517|nr:2-oxoglutarate and iron-dependent oxygenase domain-containing protein [Streptomyces sp. NRRL S-646]
MQILPVIDLEAAAADSTRFETEAQRLDRACRDAGVFEVVGHGVPAAVIESLFAVTREFFALPPEQKALVAQPQPDQVRGWSGLGREGIAYSLDEESPGDLKEKMDMGPPESLGGGPERHPGSGPHFARNVWPARMSVVWEEYYRHLIRVRNALLRLCAHAFALDDDFFDDKFDQSISMLRALHYPNQPEPPLSGQMRAGAHTDYGAFTVVTAEDRPGGLEVLRAGSWEPVPLTPGRLAVMTGDLFAEWTGDRWPSTLHRVVNPTRAQALDITTRFRRRVTEFPDDLAC